ncbi:MAG: 6,7-dimethyl-8-ribityllumazine synthase [Paludibacteraceae bacterium]|nr:6,7-dimethyl-8-ribityllumazine synthase [Paludibacteraceae bacterium]
MTTEDHNLSDYNADSLPEPDVLSHQRYAIVVADWNADITHKLLEGAVKTLLEHGVEQENIEITHVPGTVELTYAAACCEYVDAIIMIGCVIRGETPHFDYVCQSVTQGMTTLNLKADIPVIFSVLTTNDKQQALDRAGGKLGNKGVEGAITAIKMANL